MRTNTRTLPFSPKTNKTQARDLEAWAHATQGTGAYEFSQDNEFMSSPAAALGDLFAEGCVRVPLFHHHRPRARRAQQSPTHLIAHHTSHLSPHFCSIEKNTHTPQPTPINNK